MPNLAGNAQWRWPAEWEPQSAVLLAWPTEQTDWSERLEQAERCFTELLTAIRQFTPAVLCLNPGPIPAAIKTLPAAPHPLALVRIPYDDGWLRDSGPITLVSDSGPAWLDFRFNAWDGEFAAAQDNKLVERLRGQQPFGTIPRQRLDWVLEGGAVDTDGQGTILTTRSCMQARLPHKSQQEFDQLLCGALRCDRVLWLEHGELIGDHTNGHIDTLARFADPAKIVFQGCRNQQDPQHDSLNEMAAELRHFRRSDGQPYQLFELPDPPLISDDEQQRLPASYANFLITNQAVLVPAYGGNNDQAAQQVIAEAFSGREVVGIDCRVLLENGGSLHCVTMQVPSGVANFS